MNSTEEIYTTHHFESKMAVQDPYHAISTLLKSYDLSLSFKKPQNMKHKVMGVYAT